MRNALELFLGNYQVHLSNELWLLGLNAQLAQIALENALVELLKGGEEREDFHQFFLDIFLIDVSQHRIGEVLVEGVAEGLLQKVHIVKQGEDIVCFFEELDDVIVVVVLLTSSLSQASLQYSPLVGQLVEDELQVLLQCDLTQLVGLAQELGLEFLSQESKFAVDLLGAFVQV